MGLFSSKKKVKVNVTVQKIFEESQIPNSAQNGIIKGIINDGDIVNYMMEDLVQSIGIRADTGLRESKAKGYNVGIPQSDVKTYISAKTAVISAIQSNIGKAITPEYYYMGPLNSMHFGWQYCYDALGYAAETNELSVLSAQTGFKCYLADMKATYLKEDYDWMVENNDTGMLAQLGPSPTSGYLPSAPFNLLASMGQYAAQPPYEVSSVATEDYVTITYEFQDANGAFIRRGLTVSMAAFENTADFHMCRYKDSTGKTGFFTYQHATGKYPLIDTAFAIANTGVGTYYPWTYFRRNKMSIKALETKETVDQMIKWCGHLGVDFDTLYEGVHQDPQVDLTVQQAMMIFAISPGSKHPSELEYLFKYFMAMHQNSLSQQQLVGGLYQQMQAFTSSPSQVQRVHDNRFAMSFTYSGIRSQRVSGSIGPVGTYTGEYGIVSQNHQQFLTQGPAGVGRDTSVTNQPAWTYRRQILDAVYEEVSVYNLTVNYEVHDKKGFAAGTTQPELLIPLDHAIVQTISVPRREQLLCRTLHMLVNTVIIEKTPWYASGAFRIVMLVVAVVITIFTMGATWQTIVAAGTLGTITAMALSILTYIVKALIIQAGVKLFVKVVGPEIAFIAAIALVAYGGYTAFADPTATWAQSLVSLGTNLAQSAGSAYQAGIQDEMRELQDGMLAFRSWAQDQLDSLADMSAQLGLTGQTVQLDPWDTVKMGPDMIWGESPNDLYNRTVHSGNIGALSFSMAENYAQTMLTLPTFNQTHGDFYDGGLSAT